MKYAIENGIINEEVIQEQIMAKKREELLKKHPYKVWMGTNEKWYTYICDEKKGRVLKKRSTRKDIENIIIDSVKEKEENPFIKDIFCDWLTGKLNREEISKSTRDRYWNQYKQCFEEFGNRRIKNVAEYDIEEFILNSIHDFNLTGKGFSNLRTLIFGIFKLAKKRKLVSFSITEVVKDIEISPKSFRKEIKADNEQVFMIDEIPKINKHLEGNQDIVNLGILLLFKSGMRIGELAGLKYCDIHGNTIHVNRTEISYKENSKRIFLVRDFPKSEAGIRDVIIPERYEWIIKKIKHLNPFGEFLFEENGRRIKTEVFRYRLKKICSKTDVIQKSPHKIRKTYGSILIDSGISESLVISQMGHTDINTTKTHYYKNRKDNSQKAEEINSVISL